MPLFGGPKKTGVTRPRRRGVSDPLWAQVSIALIAIGSVLVSVDTLTAPTEVTPTGSQIAPSSPILIAGLSIVILGVLSVLVLAFSALSRWREDRATPFRVRHDPSCGDCLESSGTYRTVRVEVTNLSGIGIQRVRSYMRVLEGIGRSYFLHIEHDNEPTYSASRTSCLLALGIGGVWAFWYRRNRMDSEVVTRPQ
jgi:hypothetical protein